MPVFTATQTVNTTPAVSVDTLSEVPYQQIRSGLGDFVYETYQFYLDSPNFSQLSNPFYYIKYDFSGQRTARDIIPFVSPYQQQKSVFVDMRSDPLLIDGRNSLNFNLFPLTTIRFKIYSIQISTSEMAAPDGKEALTSNFERYETATGNFNFFDDFKEKL